MELDQHRVENPYYPQRLRVFTFLHANKLTFLYDVNKMSRPVRVERLVPDRSCCR